MLPIIPLVVRGLITYGAIELISEFFNDSANEQRREQRRIHYRRIDNYHNVEWKKRLEIKRYLVNLRNDAFIEKKKVGKSLGKLKKEKNIIKEFLQNNKMSISSTQKNNMYKHIKKLNKAINRHFEEIENIQSYINKISERKNLIYQTANSHSLNRGQMINGLYK